MLEQLAGNDRLKDGLHRALASGRLSHGILLCGEEGCGCGYAARCLAADYLYPAGGEGAAAVMESRAAECTEVRGEGASGEIKIDRIRSIRRDVFDTALSASGRAVIIYGAHHFNQSSANALLKVLEEPPEGVLFILTASSSAAVLPTIRSRCQIYTMAPVSPAQCTDWLRRSCPDCKNPELLSRVYAGCIGRAAAAARDEEAAHSLETALQLARLIGQQDEYSLMAALAAYEKDKSAARRLLDDLRSVAAAALRRPEGDFGLVPVQAAYVAGLCTWSLEGISRNLHPKLLLTCLALRLCRRPRNP